MQEPEGRAPKATPTMEERIPPSEPFEIHWRIGEAFSGRIEYFAVGVLPEDAEIGAHAGYKWLAVER